MALQDFVEEIQVLGRDLVDKVKSLIHEGNVAASSSGMNTATPSLKFRSLWLRWVRSLPRSWPRSARYRPWCRNSRSW